MKSFFALSCAVLFLPIRSALAVDKCVLMPILCAGRYVERGRQAVARPGHDAAQTGGAIAQPAAPPPGRDQAPASFNPQALGRELVGFGEGEGKAVSVGAIAGLGIGQSYEALNFGGTSNYYCGGSVGLGYDVSVSGAGTQIRTSKGCQGPTDYAGGFLNFTVGIGIPETKVGVAANYGAGVDTGKVKEHLPKAVAAIRRYFDRMSDADLAAFSKKLLLVNSVGRPMGSPAAWQVITQFLSSLYKAGDSKSRDVGAVMKSAVEGRDEEIKNFLLSGGRDIPALKEVLGQVRDDIAKGQPDLAEALRETEAMLTSCDALSASGQVGIGATPASATLSFSYSSYLGGMGMNPPLNKNKLGPVGLWATDTRLAAPVLASMVDQQELTCDLRTAKTLALFSTAPAVASPLLCTLPMLQPSCDIARGLSDAGLATIPGAAFSACQKVEEHRNMLAGHIVDKPCNPREGK